ncbi:hypothetical protein ANN_14514, partial [Periplaneta americana]
ITNNNNKTLGNGRMSILEEENPKKQGFMQQNLTEAYQKQIQFKYWLNPKNFKVSMALLRGKDVPEGSLRLSEEEAIQYQLKLINGWEPKSDVWPFHFGFGILGAGSALSAMYINSHFRSRLRLHTYGRMSTYLPIVILPSMLSALFHHVVQ